ncbi:hypothetical protein SEPCBS57363_000306 [Sporothrix epigloea]|uniref:Major facilitator superfamily (MFS) profile domain-containing protein n=1 Tax=Sporothrix epigloea TaxID=1892477 RepID=A0ABP0D3Y6_9PEZI
MTSANETLTPRDAATSHIDAPEPTGMAQEQKTGSTVNGSNTPTGENAKGNPVQAVKDTEGQAQLPPPPKPQYMTGMPFYITFGSLMTAALLAALNASTVGTAIPSITNSFHSIQDVGWYGSSYLISKPFAFIAFIILFELGNLIAGVAVSSPMLIVGRAITGIGGSGLITGAMVIITTIRPLEKRPMLIGTVMGTVALGQVAGPMMGGVLSQVTWRWVFYINLPLGGIVILLFLFAVRLPATPRSAQSLALTPGNSHATRRQHFERACKQLAQVDWPGFFCFAAACALLLIGLEWGGTKYPWTAGQVIGPIVAGSVLFALFAVWSQYLGDRALLPFRLLRYGHINVFCGLTALTQAASVFVLMSYLPIWFQGVQGASPLVSGVMLLPTILSQLVAALLCGFLVQRTGYYLPEVVGGNALVLIASGLFTTFRPSTSTGEWIGYQILGGAGRGFVMQLLSTVIQANVPPSDIPLGISYVMFCQYFGGAVAICGARTVLTSTMASALARYAPTVDAATVINMGVTDLRTVIPASEIQGVIVAYNKALVNVFYLQLALSATALVCSCFLGWRDIRKPCNVQKKKEDMGVALSKKADETDGTVSE